MNHSSTPDACGERHAIGGHRRPRRGTSMLCDRHQRLRLPPSCSCRRDCVQRRERCVWTQRTPPIWSHSPQCAECDHVGGRAWVRPVRRRRWTQFCGIERGRFRRMPDGDRRTRRATSHPCFYYARTTDSRRSPPRPTTVVSKRFYNYFSYRSLRCDRVSHAVRLRASWCGAALQEHTRRTIPPLQSAQRTRGNAAPRRCPPNVL